MILEVYHPRNLLKATIQPAFTRSRFTNWHLLLQTIKTLEEGAGHSNAVVLVSLLLSLNTFYTLCFFLKLRFTLCKVEQPLQGKELQEKEAQKD